MQNMLVSEVYSFTKGRSYTVCVSADYLTKEDNVLFIDDFLANGNAAKGILDILNQAGATLEGMGFLIEKGFQEGGKYLRDAGYDLHSMAIIEKMEGTSITFREE